MGWILFRAPNLEQALNYYSILFSPYHWSLTASFYQANIVDTKETFFMVVACLITFLPSINAIPSNLSKVWRAIPEFYQMTLMFLYSLLLCGLAVITISGTNFSPFLYFEF
jgi:hypothetical protein